MAILQDDKVIVPKLNIEGIVESVFTASGKEYIILKGMNEAFLTSEVFKVNEDAPVINGIPVPSDVNQPVIPPVANEKYDIDKDERPEEYKEAQEYDYEEIQENSVVLTPEEYEMITNTLENALELLNNK